MKSREEIPSLFQEETDEIQFPESEEFLQLQSYFAIDPYIPEGYSWLQEYLSPPIPLTNQPSFSTTSTEEISMSDSIVYDQMQCEPETNQVITQDNNVTHYVDKYPHRSTGSYFSVDLLKEIKGNYPLYELKQMAGIPKDLNIYVGSGVYSHALYLKLPKQMLNIDSLEKGTLNDPIFNLSEPARNYIINHKERLLADSLDDQPVVLEKLISERQLRRNGRILKEDRPKMMLESYSLYHLERTIGQQTIDYHKKNAGIPVGLASYIVAQGNITKLILPPELIRAVVDNQSTLSNDAINYIQKNMERLRLTNYSEELRSRSFLQKQSYFTKRTSTTSISAQPFSFFAQQQASTTTARPGNVSPLSANRKKG